MKPAFRLTPVIAALGVAAGLTFAAGAQAQTIKIGVVGPTTGPVTQYGDMVREGVDTAVERINAAGGVNGKKLETVVIDDGCEPKQGPVAANRVVNSKIGFVVGHVCSGATIAAADVYNNEGVVMVTLSATSPALTDGKNYEFIFRTIGRDDQQGPAAAKFVLKSSPKKVAVLHDKQSYGQGIATAVKNDLEKGGIPVAIFEGINAGDSDYPPSSPSSRAAAWTSSTTAATTRNGPAAAPGGRTGREGQVDGSEGTGNPDINAIAGDAVEGMLLTLPADFSQSAANAEIVKAFQAKRNAAGAFQMTAYTATLAIADGIKGAGSEDPAKVAKFLYANTLDTPIGKISWNKQGDLTNFQFDVFTWHKDGSKTVYK